MDFSNHYDRLGENTETFKCSPHNIIVNTHAEFVKEILKCMLEDKIVDLAAGNCIFARTLLSLIKVKQPILCVEPFQLPKHSFEDDRIETLCMNAFEFATKDRTTFDKVIIRMALHHFGNENIPTIFKNIYDRMEPGGILVIIRMASCENLPWFQKLKDTFNAPDPTHLPVEQVINLLKQSGFDYAVNDPKSSKHVISKQNLIMSMRVKYVSTISRLSDKELEEGILELQEKYKDVDEIEFQEDFDFFIAKKK